jgi:hypothetical protein
MISDIIVLLVERLANDGNQDVKFLRLEDTISENNIPKRDIIFEYEPKKLTPKGN